MAEGMTKEECRTLFKLPGDFGQGDLVRLMFEGVDLEIIVYDGPEVSERQCLLRFHGVDFFRFATENSAQKLYDGSFMAVCEVINPAMLAELPKRLRFRRPALLVPDRHFAIYLEDFGFVDVVANEFVAETVETSL